jgi:chromosome segregation ATPase
MLRGMLSKREIGMSNANVNSPNPNWHEQQDLIDRIAELEHKLENTLDSNDLYQNQIDKLIRKILELKLANLKPNREQDLLYRIDKLEHRKQNIEKNIDRITEFKLRVQNVIDILEK